MVIKVIIVFLVFFLPKFTACRLLLKARSYIFHFHYFSRFTVINANNSVKNEFSRIILSATFLIIHRMDLFLGSSRKTSYYKWSCAFCTLMLALSHDKSLNKQMIQIQLKRSLLNIVHQIYLKLLQSDNGSYSKLMPHPSITNYEITISTYYYIPEVKNKRYGRKHIYQITDGH